MADTGMKGDKDMYDINKLYGLIEYTLEEEIALPELVQRTRRNKMQIIDQCEHIKYMLDYIKERAKKTKEEDDQFHSDLVQKLADEVDEAYKAVCTACNVGFEGR